MLCVWAVCSISSAACSVYGPDLLPTSAQVVRRDDGGVDPTDAQADEEATTQPSGDVALAADGTAEANSDAATAAEAADDGSLETGADVAGDVHSEGDAQGEIDGTTADAADAGADADASADANAADAADAAADAGVLVEAGREAGGTVVFSDNFEDEALGAMPATGWTRVGGSSTDWEVADDMGRVFRQDRSLSTTFRACHAGPTVSGPATLSARVKVTQNGVTGPTAFLCVRFIDISNYQCLALEPGVGLQIKTAVESGPLWSTGISMGIWYNLKLSIDASGLITGYLDGNVLGSFRPMPVIGSSDIAVATLSAEAAFDDVVLTVP